MFSSTRNSCLIISSFIVLLLAFDNTWIVLSACMHQDIPSFSTQPKNVTLQVDGDAFLNCSVSRSHDRRDSLTWQVDPNVYHTKVSLSFDYKTCVKTSQLLILDVSKQPVTATCVLRHLTNLNNWQTFYSAVATVNVLYFPSNAEMRCAPQHVKILHNMDHFTARCEVPVGHPPVSISWIIEGETSMPHSLEHSIVEENGILFLNQTFQIDHSFHSKTLSCVATSHVFFPDQEVYCTIAPFVVFHRPNVDIFPSDVQLLSGAHVIHFTCSAESFPEVDTITWTCHPKNLLDGCDDKTGTSIDISLGRKNSYHTTERYQLVKVVCSATNSMGRSMTLTEIVIDRSSSGNGTAAWGKDNLDSAPSNGRMCVNATLNLQPLKMPLMDNDKLYLVGRVSFLCVVECGDNIESRFRYLKWFMNNFPVSDNKKFHVRDLGSFSGSIITVSSFGRTASDFSISCDTFINNGTVRREITFKVSEDEVWSATPSPWTDRDSFDEMDQDFVHTLRDKSSTIPTATSEDQTWGRETKTGKDKNFFGLEGTHFILIAVIGIVMSILFAACLCAFCTVLLYRYLQRKDRNIDILAQMREMNKENSNGCTAHCQQHDTVTSHQSEETTLDQNYEEPIAGSLFPYLSQNDCLLTKRLPWYSGQLSDLSGSSMPFSCGSPSSSQSADAYSYISKQSSECDWHDYLPSGNESQEEGKEIQCDHFHHN